jgi:hypothetical protein
LYACADFSNLGHLFEDDHIVSGTLEAFDPSVSIGEVRYIFTSRRLTYASCKSCNTSPNNDNTEEFFGLEIPIEVVFEILHAV